MSEIIETASVILVKFGEQSWYIRVPKNMKFEEICEHIKQSMKPLLEQENAGT